MVFFLVLALLGFVASLVVHVSTFTGSHAVGMSQAWPLHIGMFIALLPVMVGDRGRGEAGENGRPSNGQVSYVPRWMGALLAVCVVYGFVFFGLFIAGELLLPRDGRIIADEVQQTRASSAFWMVLYAAAIAGVYEGLARRRAGRAALATVPEPPASIRNANRYELAPAPGMSPWAHATVGAILSLVGFFVLPMVVALLFLSTNPSGGAWILLVAPPFFGAAIVGIRLPGTLMSRHVAAACPACGGRAYANGPAIGGQVQGEVRYTCRDCGRVCGVNGGQVEAPPSANHITA